MCYAYDKINHVLIQLSKYNIYAPVLNLELTYLELRTSANDIWHYNFVEMYPSFPPLAVDTPTHLLFIMLVNTF